jgi:hypothetical protein
MTETLHAEARPEVALGAAGTDPERPRPAWRRALPVLAVAVAFTVVVALLMLGVIAPPDATGGCGGG